MTFFNITKDIKKLLSKAVGHAEEIFPCHSVWSNGCSSFLLFKRLPPFPHSDGMVRQSGDCWKCHVHELLNGLPVRFIYMQMPIPSFGPFCLELMEHMCDLAYVHILLYLCTYQINRWSIEPQLILFCMENRGFSRVCRETNNGFPLVGWCNCDGIIIYVTFNDLGYCVV